MSIPLEDILRKTNSNGGSVPPAQRHMEHPVSSFRTHDDDKPDLRIKYTFKQFRKDSVKEHTKAILPTVRKIK